MGQHCSDTATIIFDNCRIPADHLLGKEGDGYKIALSNLESGRIGIQPQCIGMALAAFDAAIEYANERQAFGVQYCRASSSGISFGRHGHTDLNAARQLIFHAGGFKRCQLSLLKRSVYGEAICLNYGRAGVFRCNSNSWRLWLCF